jgi:predicted transcriptional regulator
MRGGLSAAIASAPEIISIGPVLAAVGTAAFVHYVTLKSDLASMEQAQAKRDQEIRELGEAKAQLEAALAQLSEESNSIVSILSVQTVGNSAKPLLLQAQVTEIVEMSINRVTELQQLITKFMKFLKDMNDILGHTVRKGKRVYKGFSRKNSFVDPRIKRVSLFVLDIACDTP